jgi:hypothetical protein
MAGYSGTPLIKKLGIKEEARVAFVGAPNDFDKDLGPLPANVSRLVRPTQSMDLVLLFTTSAADLQKNFAKVAKTLSLNGMLWVAWPKKASGVVTDLSDNNVREIGLSAGLVDVKVCAVNDVWSGLKFVYRLEDRKRLKTS